jgi:hypothetical protein
MTAKTIKIPALPAGADVTVQVRSPANVLLETVTCSDAIEAGNFVGTIAGAHAGQLIFVILISGAVAEHRVRTIADSAGPWVIVNGLNDPVGPYNITLTIDDGAVGIEGASLRIYSASYDFSKTTNASGIAIFPAPAGTYTILITSPGFDPRSVTLVVGGNISQTYSLTTSFITAPTDPLLSTGVMKVLNEFGVAEGGVTISLQLVDGPGTSGYALDTAIRSDVSDSSGQVEFTGLIRGATYSIWRSQTGVGSVNFAIRTAVTKQSFIVPNTPSFNLAEVLGQEVSA